MQPRQIRRKVLDRVWEMTSETLQLNNTYIQDFVSLGDLPNQPYQGISLLIQIASPTIVGPRRYGEGAPEQFS
jgi:hypothetical protein